jgi:hypothetical protein
MGVNRHSCGNAGALRGEKLHKCPSSGTIGHRDSDAFKREPLILVES